MDVEIYTFRPVYFPGYFHTGSSVSFAFELMQNVYIATHDRSKIYNISYDRSTRHRGQIDTHSTIGPALLIYILN